ncbi:MAG: fluoride efflux transporter CrcB [Cytophagales bacterium]|nr:fluoride efflux transporter CrcB [Cytophagales bacterium]
MQSLFLVFLGGGLGSVTRFALGKWVGTFHQQPFPWGTLAANIVACFVMGVVVGLADHRQIISASSRMFWTVGFCGGFSTFSAFSHETITLIQQGLPASMIAYIASSLLLCVAVTYAGLYLGESL